MGAVLITLSACGGGGGGSNGSDGNSDETGDESSVETTNANNVVNDARLAALSVSAGPLDQTFQASQLDYTASTGFLQLTTTITATTSDPDASLRINGGAAGSGAASAPIDLVEGANAITVLVTSEDGNTTQTYTVELTRAAAATFAQEAYLKASNAEGDDNFGWSVAVDGDTLAVGAHREDASATGGESDFSEMNAGAVYVFTRSGNIWTQQAYLKASNAESEDQFGWSVALDDNTLAVGARLEDASATGGQNDFSEPNAGAVYVFTRNAGVWSQQAYIKANNAGTLDYFGHAVALDGDTLAIGAHQENGVEGAVYVFTRTGTAWNQQQRLKASNFEALDNFGWSVALDGDSLAAGAIGEDASATGGESDFSETDAGAVYVFTRTAGIWSQQAYLKASNAEADDRFGYSVALDGDTLAAGADQEDSSATGGENDFSETDAGAVYVFTRSGTNWNQQAFLKASNAESMDHFGHAVSVDGDWLAVGAVDEASSATGGEGNNSRPLAGAVYLFARVGSAWNQQNFLKASNAGISDNFSRGLELEGDTLAIAASGEASSATGGEGDDTQPQAGAAYVFR